MIAMVFLALLMFTTAFHLLWILQYRGLTKASDSKLRTWVATPNQAPTRIQELIRYTQDEAQSLADIEGRFREVEATQVSDVDRRVAFLNVLVISAPLFGLLGTVLGMLLTFKAISAGGSATSEVIAKGISEALIATQTGMMVAIPGLILTTVAKRRRHEYVAFLARLEGITLRRFYADQNLMIRTREGETVRFKPPAATSTQLATL